MVLEQIPQPSLHSQCAGGTASPRIPSSISYLELLLGRGLRHTYVCGARRRRVFKEGFLLDTHEKESILLVSSLLH